MKAGRNAVADVKAGYKRTEVGVIPEDWDEKKIGDIAITFSGGTPPTSIPEYYNGDIYWITSGDLNVATIFSVSGRITQKGLKNSASKMVKKDTLLMALYGATSGVTAITKIDAAINQAVLAIIPKHDNTEYLFQVLSNKKNWIIDTFTQGGQPNLSGEIIRSLNIPIPPTPEQRAIATALIDADARITSLDQLIAKKRDIKQAAMQELLTGKRRLPGFSGEWDLIHLGEVLIRVTNGAVYKPTNSFGLPITRIETISDGTISFNHVGYAERTPELQNYKLERGDILFSHINSLDHIGKVAIFSGEPELYHGMNLLLLRAGESITPEFLFYWLGSHQGRKKSKSLAKQAVSQASINTNELKGIELQLPLLLEQRAIATVLSDMDAELAALEQQRDKIKNIKQGMMQELLTGRIRLT